MRQTFALTTLALFLSLAIVGCSRAAGPDPRIALARVGPPSSGQHLTVTSDAIGADGAIGVAFTDDGQNLTPPIAWTAAPGAKAYAVIIEDTDAPTPRPFVHWLVWNIPGDVTALPQGLLTIPAQEALRHIVQGANQGNNEASYFGPAPPPGSGPHHYHIQVFALSAPLALAYHASRDELVAAMRGRVIADGETVGTYAKPAQP